MLAQNTVPIKINFGFDLTLDRWACLELARAKDCIIRRFCEQTYNCSRNLEPLSKRPLRHLHEIGTATRHSTWDIAE